METIQVDTVSAHQLREIISEDPGLRILDVRTGGEFEGAHIPGSWNVPLDVLAGHLAAVASVENPVVVVCQTGPRAEEAREHLATAGKHSVQVLDGGMNAWQGAGGDVVNGQTERWAMDRQVRLVAGSTALAGVAASTVVPGAKWIAGFIGAGLTFSAVSNTCTMAAVLAKLPYNQTAPVDVDAVVAEMKASHT